MAMKGIAGELAAFLEGATSLQRFKDLGCNYWDDNAEAWAPNKGKMYDAHVCGQNLWCTVAGLQWS